MLSQIRQFPPDANVSRNRSAVQDRLFRMFPKPSLPYTEDIFSRYVPYKSQVIQNRLSEMFPKPRKYSDVRCMSGIFSRYIPFHSFPLSIGQFSSNVFIAVPAPASSPQVLPAVTEPSAEPVNPQQSAIESETLVSISPSSSLATGASSLSQNGVLNQAIATVPQQPDVLPHAQSSIPPEAASPAPQPLGAVFDAAIAVAVASAPLAANKPPEVDSGKITEESLSEDFLKYLEAVRAKFQVIRGKIEKYKKSTKDHTKVSFFMLQAKSIIDELTDATKLIKNLKHDVAEKDRGTLQKACVIFANKMIGLCAGTFDDWFSLTKGKIQGQDKEKSYIVLEKYQQKLAVLLESCKLMSAALRNTATSPSGT